MFRLVSAAILMAAALSAGGCGSDSSPNNPSPTPSGLTVSIVSGSSTLTTNAYSPNPITVTRGGTVTWVNNDSVPHTSTSDTGVWNSSTLAAGGSFSMNFPNAGSFPYHCTIHPGMVGTVSVQ
jgi:plastocyanin